MTDSLRIISIKKPPESKKIGEGSFGEVYKGSLDSYNVAIKVLILGNQEKSEKLIKGFVNEAKSVVNLNHPALIKWFGICTDSGNYAVIMEHLPKGNLRKLLSEQNHTFRWNPERWQWATQIASGLFFLHSKGFVYGSLTSRNVLLDDGFRVKLTDFGLAAIKKASQSLFMKTGNISGNLAWTAPELFKGNTATQASDVYGFGVVLWEICSGKTPYSDEPNTDALPRKITRGKRENIPKECPKDYAEVVQKCWGGNPKLRPTASWALQKLIAGKKHYKEKVIADYQKGYALYIKGCYLEALPLFEKAAEANYPPAYLKLHWIYKFHGTIELKDPQITKKWKEKTAETIEWFKKKAKEDSPEIQTDLGLCYEAGIGVSKDKKKAAEWYTKAANQGYARAQHSLGVCYGEGKGVVKDGKRAFELFSQAAAQGHAEAQANLGYCYERSIGVIQDLDEAAKHYRLAVDQGCQDARLSLTHLGYD